jgi:hypothetical protein
MVCCGEVVSSHQAAEPPLVARLRLLSILEAVSSVQNARTSAAVVTRDPTTVPNYLVQYPNIADLARRKDSW